MDNKCDICICYDHKSFEVVTGIKLNGYIFIRRVESWWYKAKNCVCHDDMFKTVLKKRVDRN